LEDERSELDPGHCTFMRWRHR